MTALQVETSRAGAAVDQFQAPPSVFGFDSRDERSRAFNLLRGQILKIGKLRQLRTLGVTSATPQVGKSFVAANLAASLSRLGDYATALIDMDLRRCSVATIFDIARDVGISEFLDGGTDNLADLACPIEGTNLTVYPAFQKPMRSAELLSGPRMDALMEQLREHVRADIIVFDMPPVFANDDAVIIGQKLDAYLFVIEDGVTTKVEVREAIRLLAPAVCVGTVLNRYRGGLAADGYNYGFANSGYGDYYR